VIARIVEIAADLKTEASQRVGQGAKDGIADIPELFVDGIKILPAQAEVHGEIGLHLEVVLHGPIGPLSGKKR